MALVLLFDDDALVVDLVRAALEARGYFVGTLPDARGIVDIVEAKRPALVILDCMMPGLPGVDALRQLRASRSCFSVPVLMLTARDSVRDEQIALRAGANEYLRKPFDATLLADTVDGLTSKSLSRPVMRQPSFGMAVRRA
ncbi:MAG: response regulator [Sphingomonas sp.]|nr:response regulator [Sphingomonas sp.]